MAILLSRTAHNIGYAMKGLNSYDCAPDLFP
jgi:hypothetical protein